MSARRSDAAVSRYLGDSGSAALQGAAPRVAALRVAGPGVAALGMTPARRRHR